MSEGGVRIGWVCGGGGGFTWEIRFTGVADITLEYMLRTRGGMERVLVIIDYQTVTQIPTSEHTRVSLTLWNERSPSPSLTITRHPDHPNPLT